MGTSVEVGDQSDQVPAPQQQEPVGATKQVEPTPEVRNLSNQVLELLAQKEPQTKKTEVPPGGKRHQVELDEVKGSEVQTEEHNKECEACHHFFSSNPYRCSHIIRYHKKLLKLCALCKRRFMFPWDFNSHLDSLHRKCEECQLYLNDDDEFWEHREIEHITSMDTQAQAEPQVSPDSATLDTSHQDRQVKCKYCDRHFASITKCNMHINRRHKKVACPKCKKCFVKQVNCDNHFRDVHKFACTLCGEVFGTNTDLHKQKPITLNYVMSAVEPLLQMNCWWTT